MIFPILMLLLTTALRWDILPEIEIASVAVAAVVVDAGHDC
jgi:hypothetical protein